MTKRVTIVIEDELDRKLRRLQAKQIMTNAENGDGSYSYSKAINDALRKTLK